MFCVSSASSFECEVFLRNVTSGAVFQIAAGVWTDQQLVDGFDVVAPIRMGERGPVRSAWRVFSLAASLCLLDSAGAWTRSLGFEVGD